MIEFKKDRYFIGVWFIGDGKKDWMAALWRDEPDPEGQWTLQYRFRYYETKDAFDGKDDKSWYRGHGTYATEREAEESLHKGAAIIESTWPEYADGRIPKREFVPLHSADQAENIQRLSERPFAHVRVQEGTKP